MQKLHLSQPGEESLLPREKQIISFIQTHSGCKSSDIAKGTGLSRIIIIRQLSALVDKDLIEKHGSGSGTNYSVR